MGRIRILGVAGDGGTGNNVGAILNGGYLVNVTVALVVVVVTVDRLVGLGVTIQAVDAVVVVSCCNVGGDRVVVAVVVVDGTVTVDSVTATAFSSSSSTR